MEFQEFRNIMQNHVTKMLEDQQTIFAVDIDKDVLWETYLDSFPEGTNEIYRERREYDCSCCKHFIRSFGNVVVIKKDNTLVSIWDFQTNDEIYQPVINALSSLVKSSPIDGVFITKESAFGTERSHEQLENGTVQTWNHFRIDLPRKFVTTSSKSESSLIAETRDVKNVFKRSLEEISRESIEIVLDLIAQKSLYKGDEWKGQLEKFLYFKIEYNTLNENEKDNYCWRKSIEIGPALGKIKNHSIGVLLNNISDGVELNEAVRKYEAIVAPSNYKRPKAIFTQKMIEQAQQTLIELGLENSLGRRHAMIDDITINNILFANKDTIKKLGGDIFNELKQEVAIDPKRFDKIEEVSVDDFIKNILPKVTNIEALIENRHMTNFVSLIAPENKDSKNLFKWNNGFSWAYQGNITDSMKQRVKDAGGNVTGVLRFSLQWNEDSDNHNDFDAHCIEPNKNHIYFDNKGRIHPSSGILDVDIVHPTRDQVAVENITWTNLNRMQEGIYELFVDNYTHRGGRSGFSAEIEFDNQITSFNYNKELRQKEKVLVAKLKYSKKNGFSFVKTLPSTTSSKEIWNLKTNQFHPISVCMFSPNYWDEQTGIGHKHLFFMVDGCKNDTQPNGFFNEFLIEDLIPHRKVFEALGSKMRVDESEVQLSGLGFSSTQRNSLVCKVEGSFSRTIKVVF